MQSAQSIRASLAMIGTDTTARLARSITTICSIAFENNKFLFNAIDMLASNIINFYAQAIGAHEKGVSRRSSRSP